jgi:hypothetical protein
LINIWDEEETPESWKKARKKISKIVNTVQE